MFFVFYLLSLSFSRLNKVSQPQFNQALSEKGCSFVLFSSLHCQSCKKILNVLEPVKTRFKDSINIFYLESEECQEIYKKFNIQFAPQLAIFRGTKLITFYCGEWNANPISDFLKSQIQAKVEHLNTTFDVFDFQNLNPASLIFSSPKMIDNAKDMLKKYGGAFHIGIVQDQKVADELELPPVLFSRPYGELSLSFDSINEEKMDQLVRSPFIHIANSEVVGITPTLFTFLALVDDHDPLHVTEAITRMKLAKDEFGDNISYQFCDFITCADTVRQLGLISYQNPCYVIHEKLMDRIRIEPFRKIPNKPEEVLDWLKFQVKGIEIPKSKEEIPIPRLYAGDFITKVLDPKLDVILLVAAPGMQLYEESATNFRILMQLFKNIKTVKFYEFNRYTEHVQGLEIQDSDKPILSIWPASPEPRGNTFGAYLSLPIIIENLLKLITTQIDDDQLTEMTETLKEILQNQTK